MPHLPGRRLGVEPSSAADDARARGLEVVKAGFTLAQAERTRDQHGPADVVVANHVLPRVADTNGFVRSIRHLLAKHGTAVIEVQDFAALLLGNQFDHVYHQHRAYFTVGTLTQLLVRWGLQVFGVERTEAQGGSLRVLARRCDPIENASVTLNRFDRMDAYRGMQDRADLTAIRLREQPRSQGRSAALQSCAGPRWKSRIRE